MSLAAEKSRPRLLLTGGTGFLGRHLVPLLRSKYDVDLVSRSGSADVKGDLTRWNAGFGDLEALRKKKYDAFVHLAGLYDLTASTSDCYLNNVTGTSHALRIAYVLGVPVFINTSSIAAGINSKLSVVKPYDLNFGVSFPDSYSESKALAEQLIQNWRGGPDLRVNIRPGVLIGPSTNGRIDRIDGPYHAPRALEKLRGLIEAFPGAFPLPGAENRRLPLVPVDACAAAFARLVDWSLECGETGYKSYHLVPEQGLSVREFYKSTLKHLYIRNRGFRLVESLPPALMKKISKWLIRFPEEELHYLLAVPKYDTSGARRILGDNWCPEFESYERVFWSGYEEYVSHR